MSHKNNTLISKPTFVLCSSLLPSLLLSLISQAISTKLPWAPSLLCPTFRNPILWVLWALAFLYPLFLLCYSSHSDSYILQFIPMQKSALAFLCPGRGHWVSLLFLVNSYSNKWRWISFSRSIYRHRDLWADGFMGMFPGKGRRWLGRRNQKGCKTGPTLQLGLTGSSEGIKDAPESLFHLKRGNCTFRYPH